MAWAGPNDTPKVLADVTLINNKNVNDYGISNLYNRATAVSKLNARPASAGNTDQYKILTGEASGGFRGLNAGLDRTASVITSQTETLYYLDMETAPIDVAALRNVADPEAMIKNEIVSSIRGNTFRLEQQFFTGVNGTNGGFNGLAQRYGSLGQYCIGAGSTNTGHLTSVYLVYSPSDNTGVSMVMGGNQSISVGDTYQTRCLDANGKAFTGLVTPIGAWYGLAIGANFAVVRIANIDTASTSNNLTDKLIYAGMKLFPAWAQPNHIFMDRTAQEQLRVSRTATNATGAPAPRPTEVEGVEITVTEGITDTEATVS